MAARINDAIICTKKTKTLRGARNGRMVAMATTTIATATVPVVILLLRHRRLQFRVIKLYRRIVNGLFHGVFKTGLNDPCQRETSL